MDRGDGAGQGQCAAARSLSGPDGRGGVLAAIGVITDNPILIVGAMAVSPDLLPIYAACVGIRRGPGSSCTPGLGTLLLGIMLTWAVSAALAWGLQAVGILTGDFQVHDSSLHGLAISTTRPSWWR